MPRRPDRPTGRPPRFPGRRPVATRPVTLAAAAAALVVSVGVSSLAVAGRSDPPAPPAAPTTTALAAPDERTLAVVRETGRLRVDVAVARATLQGADDDAALEDLRRALDAAEEWLAANDPAPPDVAADLLLDAIAVHRETLATLAAHVGGARAAPTVDVTVTPHPAAPTRRAQPRPAPVVTPRAGPGRTSTTAPAPPTAPATTAPAVAPEPSTPPTPTDAPGSTPPVEPPPPTAGPAPAPTEGGGTGGDATDG